MKLFHRHDFKIECVQYMDLHRVRAIVLCSCGKVKASIMKAEELRR